MDVRNNTQAIVSVQQSDQKKTRLKNGKKKPFEKPQLIKHKQLPEITFMFGGTFIP